MRHASLFCLIGIVLLGNAPLSQAQLPVVEDVHFESFREHCRCLRLALVNLKAPWAPDLDKKLKEFVDGESKDGAAAAEAIQKVLDTRCLIGVTINPESRVKAMRGPALAELRYDRETIFLVKIHNEAGVTHALIVTGPQLRSADQSGGGRWLEAAVHGEPPLSKTLSGQKVEYVVLRLKAHEAGKREATLQFDVGQGTQDLGFRAEVPVLFTVKAAER